MSLALAVEGAGMVTPLGRTTGETIEALHRGERRFVRTSLVDLHGDRMTGSFVWPVGAQLQGAERACALARAALIECIESARSRREPSSMCNAVGERDMAAERRALAQGPSALFLCAPLSWGSLATAFEPAFAPSLEDWTGVASVLVAELQARGSHVPPELRFVLQRGHAAGVLALQQAAALLARGEAAQAWIVGVDAHGNRATLERLDLLGALRSHRSQDGFLPGEAAAALCVRPAPKGSTAPLVRGLGSALETEARSTARGLTAAVTQALDEWAGSARTLAVAAIDLNGERARANDWSLAAARTLWRERATPRLLHAADQLGDTGAATVPLFLGLLAGGAYSLPAQALGRAGAALLMASSRDGLRGAVVFERV